MSYFGKRPAIYANDSTNHKPVGLFPCSDCGALVTEVNKDAHTIWHETVEARIKAAEEKPPQVIINNPPYTQPYTPPITPQPWNPNIFPNFPTYITSTSPNISGGFNTSGTSGNVTFSTFIPKDDDGDCDCDCGGVCE